VNPVADVVVMVAEATRVTVAVADITKPLLLLLHPPLRSPLLVSSTRILKSESPVADEVASVGAELVAVEVLVVALVASEDYAKLLLPPPLNLKLVKSRMLKTSSLAASTKSSTSIKVVTKTLHT